MKIKFIIRIVVYYGSLNNINLFGKAFKFEQNIKNRLTF